MRYQLGCFVEIENAKVDGWYVSTADIYMELPEGPDRKPSIHMVAKVAIVKNLIIVGTRTACLLLKDDGIRFTYFTDGPKRGGTRREGGRRYTLYDCRDRGPTSRTKFINEGSIMGYIKQKMLCFVRANLEV